MKATLILTTLLGAAIASPVAIANVEAEKRDLEPRVLPGLALSDVVPGGGALAGLGLPPLFTGDITKGNVIQVIAQLVQGILAAILNINDGFGGNLGLPTTPPVPNIPAPAIARGNITLDQYGALIASIKMQGLNLTSIIQKLPKNLSSLQNQQIAAMVTETKKQVDGLAKVLPGATSTGGLSGSAVPLGGLADLTTALAPLLAIVSGLIGPLLTGLLSVLTGGLLSSLPV